MSTSRRIYFGSYFEEFSPRNSGVEEPGPSLVVLLKGQLSHLVGGAALISWQEIPIRVKSGRKSPIWVKSGRKPNAKGSH